jgi:hypothetical protein
MTKLRNTREGRFVGTLQKIEMRNETSAPHFRLMSFRLTWPALNCRTNAGVARLDAFFDMDHPGATACAVDSVRTTDDGIVLPAVSVKLFPSPCLGINQVLDPSHSLTSSLARAPPGFGAHPEDVFPNKAIYDKQPKTPREGNKTEFHSHPTARLVLRCLLEKRGEILLFHQACQLSSDEVILFYDSSPKAGRPRRTAFKFAFRKEPVTVAVRYWESAS